MPHYPLKRTNLSEQHDSDGNETPLFAVSREGQRGPIVEGLFPLFDVSVVKEHVCVYRRHQRSHCM